MPDNIKIGLAKRERQRMVASGATAEALAAQDAKIATLQNPPNPTVVAQDNAIRSLIGDGMDDLDGPEMAALRQRIRTAEERAEPAKPVSAKDKINAGLNARRSKPRDDTHLPNWEAEPALRRK